MSDKNVTLKATDMMVMKIFMQNAFILPNKTISMKELIELINGSDEIEYMAKSTVYNSVKYLLEAGYLKEGVKLGKARKFHLTALGAEKYSEYVQTSIEEKEKLVLAYTKAKEPDAEPDWAELYNEVQKHYFGQVITEEEHN